jgi:LuxR family maltose regulon positive regulatory protein
MFTNDLSAAEARLQHAKEWLQIHAQDSQARTVRGWIATIQASIFRMRGDLIACVDLSRQTIDLLPETELIGAAARVNLVHEYLVSGDVRLPNERLVADAVATARASGNLISILRSLTLLARLQVLQGRLNAAVATYTQAAQVAPGPDRLQTLVNIAAYYVGMGDLLRERNDLASAESYLLRGMDYIRGTLTVDAHVVWRGYLAEARLQQTIGDTRNALATLGQFEQLAHKRDYFPTLIRRAAAARARLWLIQGDLDAATRWMQQSGLHQDDAVSFPRESEYVTLARLLIAQGRAEAALGVLDRLLAGAEQGQRMHSVIDILTARALAQQAQGQPHAALTSLERALAFAAPEGYVRAFVDEGEPIVALLAQIARGESLVAPYAASLLAAFPNQKATRRQGVEELASSHDSVFSLFPGLQASLALAEPLSPRELEILQLIADGHSNQAIADRLIVAVSTVKKHINNMFGKLDVQSRTQALLRARELNLL